MNIRPRHILWATFAFYAASVALVIGILFVVFGASSHRTELFYGSLAFVMLVVIAATARFFAKDYRILHREGGSELTRAKASATIAAEVCGAAAFLFACFTLLPVGLDAERVEAEQRVLDQFKPAKLPLGQAFVLECAASQSGSELCRELEQLLEHRVWTGSDFKKIETLPQLARHPVAQDLLRRAHASAQDVLPTARHEMSRYFRASNFSQSASTRFDLLLAGLLIAGLSVALKCGRAVAER